jgi:hypothetical protein
VKRNSDWNALEKYKRRDIGKEQRVPEVAGRFK